ncbi:MAG: Fis family transcriptional regulator, partial [Planctomycetes bacterium]|nr:Fis family transcriptional regulator [Planctomycetota bacterium]
RVLQERTFEPLGGTESVKANVRVVAATNRELAKLVEDGKFRSDLYYRINVVRLTLPPLRERRDDIPLLAEHFIGKFNRLKGKDVAGLSAEALAILVGHDYPGNVRELENVIEHAFVLCGAGMIEPKHLPEHLRPAVPTAGATVGVAETLADMERRLILDALQRNAWNRLAAAKELGIHKSTLFRKIQALGITLPATDGRTAKS